jgi:hypothetical protein
MMVWSAGDPCNSVNRRVPCQVVHVPKPDIAVVGGRGQSLAIGRERDVAEHLGLTVEAPDLASGCHAPETRAAINGPRRQQPSVRRER